MFRKKSTGSKDAVLPKSEQKPCQICKETIKQDLQRHTLVDEAGNSRLLCVTCFGQVTQSGALKTTRLLEVRR